MSTNKEKESKLMIFTIFLSGDFEGTIRIELKFLYKEIVDLMKL